VSAITLFAGFFAAAIANIQRPEAHKRLMLLATISLLQAAMGRVFFVLATGGGPGLRPGLGQPPPLIIGLVPRHRGFDRLILGYLRMGKSSGATSSSMLRGTPG
jgi:hypothetical protein